MKGWISVSERLPEEDGWYVITVGKNRNVYADYYDSKHREWQDYCGSDVIAWQPFPEPYKEDK